MEDLTNLILKEIESTKDGISCLSLSKKLGKNRVTVSKYLEILKANGKIDSRQVAQANIWMIKKDMRTKILIVDDEPHIVTLIRLSLSSLDANICFAYDGISGLEKVYQEKPNMIILDLMMPKMSGYDVYERLKSSELTKDIPVIVLTAKSDVSKRMESMLLKKDMFMTKPFDPTELETNIKLLLSTKEDFHPITKLPTEKSIVEKINDLLSMKNSFYLSVIKFDDIILLKKKIGFTKITTIIEKFSHIINDSLKDKLIMLGQSNENSILILTKIKVSLEIKKAYDSISKYLSNEDTNIVIDEYDEKELKHIDIEEIVK